MPLSVVQFCLNLTSVYFIICKNHNFIFTILTTISCISYCGMLLLSMASKNGERSEWMCQAGQMALVVTGMVNFILN